MTEFEFHQQKHGYRNGHQLIEGTIRLDRVDQDAVDRLSDLSGQIRPGEVIPSYLTVYPLPSGTYIVVARTWPDLSAPRAGCVLTRSVFVSRKYWEHTPDISGVIALASELPSEGTISGTIAPSAKVQPRVTDEPRAPELVEALFFEPRKPIVVFDAESSELLATRLITAFWPAFRGNFALCTYALGPRKIAGRDFDLVFAPKSVRSRFSAWTGRKIDAGPAKAVRHRWARAIAEAIFQAPVPSLSSPDDLGLLSSGSADESAFRKTLLWRELADRASSTPSAILGLLDIINSQPGLTHEAMRSASPLLVGGIEAAINTTPAEAAWPFLQTLYGKVEGRDGLETLDREISREAAQLAAVDPASAVDFSIKFAEDSDTLPVGLLLGMGQGLARANPCRHMDRIPARVGAFWVANGDEFSDALAQGIRDGDVAAETVLPFMQAGESLWREQVASKLAQQADAEAFAPLLPALLRRKSPVQASAAAIDVIRRSGLKFESFDDALIEAIRDEASMRQTREVVVSEIDQEKADRFLLKTLTLSGNDILWLASGPISGVRAAQLLTSVLREQNDRSVVEAQRDGTLRRQMLETLAQDKNGGQHAIARLIVLGAPTVDELLEFGAIALDRLDPGPARAELAATVLERALIEAKPTDKRVERLVHSHVADVGARSLVWWSTNEAIGNARLSDNLGILQRLKQDDSVLIFNVIDDVCDRLSRRKAEAIDEQISAAWASLLWQARTTSPAAHLRAASLTLSAVIDRTRHPIGEVLAAAFPAVYQELVSQTAEEQDGLLALVLALPRMLSNDWDQAKPARHGLVDAFMHSNWPPSYLLLAASRAGIVDRICLRVLRQKGGKKYLDRAIGDLGRLDAAQGAAIRHVLRSLDADAMKTEWD